MVGARVKRSYYPAAAVNLSKKDKALITKIVNDFTDLSRKNIQDWRMAIESAVNSENPNWAAFQDLLDYLMPDGHLGAVTDLRKGTVLSNPFYIRSRKTKKEVEKKTDVLKKEWIWLMMNDLLDASLRVIAAVQIVDAQAGLYDVLPHRNLVPQNNFLRFNAYQDEGIFLTDPALKGIVVTKGTHKLGAINDIIPDLIWKKNARQAWARFTEKFGDPLVTATSNSTDPVKLKRIETMIRMLGESAMAVLPEGTTIDINTEAKQGDPYNLYLEQAKYSDEQISKRLLGGTMVSDNGSSRSQSEVHERSLNYIIGESERKKIEFAFNDQILPILRQQGFPFTDDDEFIFDRSEDLRLTEQWNIVQGALNHFDIDEEWISETFNFPIKGKKQAPTIPPAQQDPGNDPQQQARFSARGFFD